MKILFLCKRYYTGKDVIQDRFGRLYEIPRQLALAGHDVEVACLNYRRRADACLNEHFPAAGRLSFSSRSLVNPKILLGFSFLFSWLNEEIARFKPDLIMGASDIPSLHIARKLAQRWGIPYAVDVYDNFESFGQARLPGFRKALKQAIHEAALVVVVSEALRNKIVQDAAPTGPVLVMPNGIDGRIFHPGDRAAARARLGLPLTGPLVGTAGGLSRMKGLATLYQAWPALATEDDSICLVLAGPQDARLPLPEGPRVMYLGQLPEDKVVSLFRALDVGVITAENSPFGQYCFPQKASEMLACGLPVVAADVGSIAHLFRDQPELCYLAGNPADLIRAIRYQLAHRTVPAIPVYEWKTLVALIEPALARIAAHPPRPSFR